MKDITAGLFLKIPILLLLVLITTSPLLLAQDDGGGDGGEEQGEFDDFDFSELPVDDYRNYSYLGFGLGYLGMHTFVDNKAMNDLATLMDMPEFSAGLSSFVGGGFFFGGIGIENIRYGFYSTSGSKEVISNVMLADDPTTPNSKTAYTRKLVYSSGLLAFQLDYALFLPPEGLIFFPGLMIARESSEIELSQIKDNGLSFTNLYNSKDFNGAQVAEVGLNRYSRIRRQSFQIRPTLTLDYAVNQLLLFRVGAGYGFNLDSEWKQSAGTTISDVPELNSDGLSLHFGLFVGLFQN